MMTSSNGKIFRVTGPLCGEFTGPGEFPTQRPVTRSFDVFFDLRLNKLLSKQPRGWWFETQSWSLWRHCNGRHPKQGTLNTSDETRSRPFWTEKLQEIINGAKHDWLRVFYVPVDGLHPHPGVFKGATYGKHHRKWLITKMNVTYNTDVFDKLRILQQFISGLHHTERHSKTT